MININNINKYFNKRKSNEIHVLNDISFQFPHKGLVCLFGPSGSGKTTLLNVICGLDDINSGKINIEDYQFNKYSANKWDDVRNKYFGYIFQNYILFNDLSVYDNLSFVLEYFNLPKEVVDERINYALKAVGMEKYKKRLCKNLSGGQQQRVAIARALVKSPKIVVADEPTGNLDEKNTNQIMNIIKKISQECLVILVTHERRIAEFYADKIIELRDGEIVDIIDNINQNILQLNDDHNIYLQEYQKDEFESNNLNVNYFFDNNQDKKINLNIIVKDGAIYIASENNEVKVKLINRDSETKIVNSKKPIITRETIEDFEYDLPNLESEQTKKSIISFRNTLKLAFVSLSTFGKRQKLFLVTFFLSAIMVVLSFSSLAESLFIDETKFLTSDRNLIYIFDDDDDEITVEKLKQQLSIEDVYIVDEFNTARINSIKFNLFEQSNLSWSDNHFSINEHSILPITFKHDHELLLGRIPEKNGEILVDKWILDLLLENNQYIQYGANNYEQFINLEYQSNSGNGKIVGITDDKSPVVYMTYDDYALQSLNYASQYINNEWEIEKPIFRDYIINNLENLKNVQVIKIDGTVIPVEEVDLKSNQVILSEDHIEKNITLFNNSKKTYEVYGYVSGANNIVYVDSNNIKDIVYDFIESSDRIAIYSKDYKDTLKEIKEYDYQAYSVYESLYQEYKLETISGDGRLLFSIISLSASLIFLYFLIRSSLISRIYDVGIYRALGVKKYDVYKLFISEILLITLFTAIPGIIFTTLIINEVNSLISVIFYPWYVPIVAMLFIFVVNSMIGLIPIYQLLRKTPSQILNKYDI